MTNNQSKEVVTTESCLLYKARRQATSGDASADAGQGGVASGVASKLGLVRVPPARARPGRPRRAARSAATRVPPAPRPRAAPRARALHAPACPSGACCSPADHMLSGACGRCTP